MKLFKCQHCAQLIYFENNTCERCGDRLGYIAETATLSALEPQGDAWRTLAGGSKLYRFCANTAFDVCNWLIEADSPNAYCAACEHNRTIPDTGIQAYLIAWRKIEAAKHRLFYTLMQLELPLKPQNSGGRRLVFDFLAAGGRTEHHDRTRQRSDYACGRRSRRRRTREAAHDDARALSYAARPLPA